jgi:ribosomal protein S18 acetylase RimI-like enzyme
MNPVSERSPNYSSPDGQFAVQLTLRARLCRTEDLPALEWMGLYTPHGQIIQDTFAHQQRGGALMILGVANEFPLAQAWLDFEFRGSAQCPCLWAVRVFPHMQGLGIGTWMVYNAESAAVARGAVAVEVGVEPENRSAARLYQRLGYRAVGTRVQSLAYTAAGQPLGAKSELQMFRKCLVRLMT